MQSRLVDKDIDLLPKLAAIEKTTHWRQLAHCSTAEARALLGGDICRKLAVLPLAVYERNGERLLSVLLGGEYCPQQVRALKFATGCEISAEVAEKEAVLTAVDALYAAAELPQAMELADTVVPTAARTETLPSTSGPINEVLQSLLARAILLEASDLHFEPTAVGLRIRYRVNGLLEEERDFSLGAAASKSLQRLVKVRAQLDITQERLPQDGGFPIHYRDQQIEIRVSTIPVAGGEKLCLRIQHNAVLDQVLKQGERALEHLGVPLQSAQLIRSVMHQRGGLLLASGPTGSGKSTLLYTLLGTYVHPTRNILSVEDPIEWHLEGVNQTQVSAQLGYEGILPSIVRQDPDLLMLGEIRNRATAIAAVQIAASGTTLVSSVHAARAYEVPNRLFELGLEPTQVSAALKVIIAQRLLPRVCVGCCEPHSLRLEVQRALALETEVVESRGCFTCRGTGVGGRLAVFEVIRVTEELREMMLARSAVTPGRLAQQAIQTGYVPFEVSIREALIAKKLSASVALRALGFFC